MERIDKQQLLKWIDSERVKWNKAQTFGAEVMFEIESGTFDDHSAQKEIAKLKEERNALLELVQELAEGRCNAETFPRARSIIAKIEGSKPDAAGSD